MRAKYDAVALCTHSSNSKICVQILENPFLEFQPSIWKTRVVQNFTLTPPLIQNFRFESTKVLLWNTPPPKWSLHGTKVYCTPSPKWKTSDLRWPKFTPKCPCNGKLQIWDDQSLLRNAPPPRDENFRFEMTKVYSEIPPPQMAWNPGDRMWRLICIPRGYRSFRSLALNTLWLLYFSHFVI